MKKKPGRGKPLSIRLKKPLLKGHSAFWRGLKVKVVAVSKREVTISVKDPTSGQRIRQTVNRSEVTPIGR